MPFKTLNSFDDSEDHDDLVTISRAKFELLLSLVEAASNKPVPKKNSVESVVFWIVIGTTFFIAFFWGWNWGVSSVHKTNVVQTIRHEIFFNDKETGKHFL